MPDLPRPRRTPDPDFVDPVDDALLEGRSSSEVPAELRELQGLLRVAAGPATEPELTGQDAALAAFSRIVGVSSSTRTRRLRRPLMLSSLLTTKLALAAAASAATFGGAAAAAYTGSLPAGMQDFAHHTIGAPAAHDGGTDGVTTDATDTEATDATVTDTEPTADPTADPTAEPTSTPVGPDATGPAAFGLCRAYTAAQAHGSKADTSVAFTNLATAAGGADNIAAYCAAVPQHGSATHPTGKPTALPTHPTGKPTAAPGRPTSVPSHATGKPTTAASHATGRPATAPSHPTGGKPAAPPAH